MTYVLKQRKYRLSELTEDDFPLFIGSSFCASHVLHVHDFTELVIVEEGRGVHIVKSFRHDIMPGDVLVIPKGMRHGYENPENLKIINVIFDMHLLDSLPDDFKHIPGFYSLFLVNPFQRKRIVSKKGFLTLDSGEIAFVRQLISRMSHEQKEKNAGWRSVCALALADLIIFLSRKASRHNLAVHSAALAETLCYMEKNHRRNISLEELSRIVNLSPRSFQRVFRSYMGMSPSSYLINVKLRHAKKLLEETDLNIGEIAEASGFGDSAYFTRQFKKIFSLPPSVYRKGRVRDR